MWADEMWRRIMEYQNPRLQKALLPLHRISPPSRRVCLWSRLLLSDYPSSGVLSRTGGTVKSLNEVRFVKDREHKHLHSRAVLRIEREIAE